MTPTPHTWKEARRLPAWLLLQKGWRQRPIAEALAVSDGAVSQGLTRARVGGPQALCHRPPPGAPRRLATEPLARLPDLLHRGPEAYGFRGQVWTRQRVAEVMHLACGMRSPPTPVGRLLKALRWSPQKPMRRARPRDETAIARWRTETWPALNKGPTPRAQASSVETNRACTPCPAWSGRMPP